MMSGTTRGSARPIGSSWPTEAAGLWKKSLRYLSVALAVSRERRGLAALDDRMLKDIGLSRSLAEREVSRDFLDVPESRIAQF